jgi:hypothetical protein
MSDTYAFFNEINNFLESNPGLKNALLVDTDGKIVASTRSGIYGTETFAEVYRNGIFEEIQNTITFSDLFFLPKEMSSELEKEHMPTMLLGAPIWERKKMLGVLIVEIDFKSIESFLEKTLTMGDTSQAYLVERDGVLRSKTRFGSNKDILEKTISNESTTQCFTGGENNGKYMRYDNHLKKSVIGVYHYIPGIDWCLISEIEKKKCLHR